MSALAALLAAAAGAGEVGAVALERPEQVAVLCAALAPIERAAPGSAGERARSREAAAERRYRVVIPGAGLAFEPFEAEEEGLRLSPRAALVGARGSVRVWTAGGDDLPVRIPREAARQVLDAQAQGRLRLALTFEIPGGELGEAPCARVAGSRTHTLAVEPVSWEYLAGGTVLARGGEAADAPVASAAQGAEPRVEVGRAVGEVATPALRGALEGHAAELGTCYRRALGRNPRLDGTLVVELKLAGRAGPPREARIAADSAQDEDLAACVQAVAARARFPRGRPGVASVPVHFALSRPDGGGP